MAKERPPAKQSAAQTGSAEDRVLAAALEVFASRGFGAATAQITRHAGVSTGILFHYYPTKDDLIAALFTSILLEFAKVGVDGFVQAVNAPEDDYHDTVHQAWTAAIEWGVQNQDKVWFLQHFAGLPDVARQHLSSDPRIQKTARHLMRNARVGARKGLFKQLPAAYLISTGLEILLSTVQFLGEHPNRLHDQKFMDESFRFFYTALTR